jgi:hypothetical protein
LTAAGTAQTFVHLFLQIPTPSMRAYKSALLVAALFVNAGCGGPENITPPVPDANVNGYWVGVEETGSVHLHITFVQTGRALSLLDNCFFDACAFYPFSNAGATVIGSQFPVRVISTSGSINGNNITYSFTLENNRTFSFTGVVQENKLMGGTISGPTLAASKITFEKDATN